MSSRKKQILEVRQNQLTLPAELIPEYVTRFSLEPMDDGRLILRPILRQDPIFCETRTTDQKIEKSEGLAEVLDIRLARKQSKNTKKRAHRQERKEVDDFSEEDAFVNLHHFSSRMEAEMIAEILNQEGLPFLIQSDDIGIFGPGAVPVPGGARLAVRKTDLQCAKSLLVGLI